MPQPLFSTLFVYLCRMFSTITDIQVIRYFLGHSCVRWFVGWRVGSVAYSVWPSDKVSQGPANEDLSKAVWYSFFLATFETFCVDTVCGLAYKVDSVFDKVKRALQRCSHVKAGEGARRQSERDAIFVRRAAIRLSGGSVWSDCERTIDEARGETTTLRCVVLTRRERVTCGDVCGRLVTTPPAPAATTDPPLFPLRGFIFAEYNILCLPAKRPSGLKNDARRRGRLICSVLQTDSLG